MSVLTLKKLTKTFGGLTAVDSFDMSIEKGEIMGLIGPNGAGKTTVFNMISGVFHPTRGKVIFQDEDITGLSPHAVARKGLVRTFQLTTLFSNMTILDNIILGFHTKAGIGYLGSLFNIASTRAKRQKMLDEAAQIADFTGLNKKKTELAKNLTHGQQRALEIAIALAAKPELLLLDEPVTGMNPEESFDMMNKIKEIRDRGITLLIVEHDMKVVMGVCDRINVLNFGKKLCEGGPKQICEDPEVIAAYLGDGVCY